VPLLYPKATVNGATFGVDFKSDYSVHFPADRSENTHVYGVIRVSGADGANKLRGIERTFRVRRNP